MIHRRPFAPVLLLALLAPFTARAGAPEKALDLGPVHATQLGVSYRKDDGEVRFRASVIARGQADLTILTAAHCLGPDDVGRVLSLRRGGQSIPARLLGVVRNPSFGTVRFGEVPGADNALALLRRLEPENVPPLWQELVPALISTEVIPDPDGQTLTVLSIDQFEKPHAVRAGNYSNPRWIEWGNAYKPIPGDSGSGVFVLRQRPDGAVEPVLIGVVTDRAQIGGGGSVISRRYPWIAQALRPAQTPQNSTESPAPDAERR